MFNEITIGDFCVRGRNGGDSIVLRASRRSDGQRAGGQESSYHGIAAPVSLSRIGYATNSVDS
ncbi:MAG: hypothetical protein CMJ64_04545 [Planctomycetaceae bacterium]|nr:hypothetical protein [Planctomycetaceae bacterium]